MIRTMMMPRPARRGNELEDDEISSAAADRSSSVSIVASAVSGTPSSTSGMVPS